MWGANSHWYHTCQTNTDIVQLTADWGGFTNRVTLCDCIAKCDWLLTDIETAIEGSDKVKAGWEDQSYVVTSVQFAFIYEHLTNSFRFLVKL